MPGMITVNAQKLILMQAILEKAWHAGVLAAQVELAAFLQIAGSLLMAVPADMSCRTLIIQHIPYAARKI